MTIRDSFVNHAMKGGNQPILRANACADVKQRGAGVVDHEVERGMSVLRGRQRAAERTAEVIGEVDVVVLDEAFDSELHRHPIRPFAGIRQQFLKRLRERRQARTHDPQRPNLPQQLLGLIGRSAGIGQRRQIENIFRVSHFWAPSDALMVRL